MNPNITQHRDLADARTARLARRATLEARVLHLARDTDNGPAAIARQVGASATTVVRILRRAGLRQGRAA